MVYSFQFTVNGDYDTVANAVRTAVGSFGRKVKEKAGGEFVFSSPVPGKVATVKYVLYLSESNHVTTMRFMCNTDTSKRYVLSAYDRFLIALEDSGLEVPVAPGEPYIVTTVALGGGLSQQYTSKQQFSVGGAMVGGMLFGDLGILIGGYNRPMQTRSRTILSGSEFFLLCYSNGMVEEREVRKNSKLYAEVMAKLNAEPVIHNREQQWDAVRSKMPEDTPLWVVNFVIATCTVLAAVAFYLVIRLFMEVR